MIRKERVKVYQRQGNVALVVGGTGALGSAIALRLASEGADVAFTYKCNAARAEELISQIEALGRKAYNQSVAIEDADAVGLFIEGMLAALGRIDTLVYASGPSFDLNFVARVSPQDWSRVIDADLKGCFNMISATLSHLRTTKGSIVAVTAAGVERAIARDILSLAPKAAITALIRGVALEEGRFGIRANCVAPGFIAGGIGQSIIDAVGPEVAATLIKAVPLRRTGSVEEIANAVSFMSSEQASYVTGTTLFVSGGMEL